MVVHHDNVCVLVGSDWSTGRLQYPSPQNWRPQLNQSATALVPPRIMGRPPRPISTLQEVTSEDEDRDRSQDAPRATTPHYLSPQPAPRQRSFSCTQHALQRRSSSHQPEPNYLIVTDRTPGDLIERVLVSPPPDAAAQPERPPAVSGEQTTTMEQKGGAERPNSAANATQTVL